MTDIIERAKAALEGVTEGPWKWSRNCQRLEGGKDGYGEVIAPGPVDCMSHCYGGTSTIEFENEPHDAEFIAAARTLVPELIAEIERVRAAAQTLGRIIERHNRDVLDITGLHHLIDETGDGPWDVVWETLAEGYVGKGGGAQ